MITIKEGTVERVKTRALVIPFYKDVHNDEDAFHRIDNSLNGALSTLLEENKDISKEGSLFFFYPHKRIAADRILLVGLGEQAKLDLKKIREFGGKLCSFLKKNKVEEFCMLSFSYGLKSIQVSDAMQALCEGILLASYSYDKYKTHAALVAAHAGEKDKGDDKQTRVRAASLLPSSELEKVQMKQAIETAEILTGGVFLVRDLVNGPPNEVTPAFLASAATGLAKKHKIQCKVLDEQALHKMKFGLLLAVGQGSEHRPKLVVLEYKPPRAKATIALVGKGITFDAGGLQAKQGKQMADMKMDMAGAAAVLGTVITASRLRLPVHLVGVMGCVENMPGGRAYRPGDILHSASGKTVEVWHTDAEGRLVLGDALHHATTYKPDAIIDLATLTGAVVVALGTTITGLMSNNDALASRLKAAAAATGEKVWQLPIEEEHTDMIKSDIADLKNLGSYDGDAGTITAGAFLKEFVGTTPWAHLDIAGTAMASKDNATSPKGATGVGVRLLISYLQDISAEK